MSNKQSIEESYQIIGNQPLYAIKNMYKALSMFEMFNTNIENLRLKACEVILQSKGAI
tara:strand:- start:548 stop:721 length:174 start_codon:yes stop_codon:yes gene_type:complete